MPGVDSTPQSRTVWPWSRTVWLQSHSVASHRHCFGFAKPRSVASNRHCFGFGKLRSVVLKLKCQEKSPYRKAAQCGLEGALCGFKVTQCGFRATQCGFKSALFRVCEATQCGLWGHAVRTHEAGRCGLDSCYVTSDCTNGRGTARKFELLPHLQDLSNSCHRKNERMCEKYIPLIYLYGKFGAPTLKNGQVMTIPTICIKVLEIIWDRISRTFNEN